MSGQHQYRRKQDRFDDARHRSSMRLFMRAVAASPNAATAPTSRAANAYGPSQPNPSAWSATGATMAAATKVPPSLLRSAIAAFPARTSKCPLAQSTARGDGLLLLGSFVMVVWVMMRGLA